MSPIIVWFRQDLRLGDNPALHAAREMLREKDGGGCIIPLYVWAPDEEGAWTPGGASRYWLHQSLAALAKSIESRGSRLILRTARGGGTLAVLRDVVRQTGAGTVLWNRRYEPAIIARDKVIKEKLRSDGLTAESYNGTLLHEPWTIQNKSRKPFQVFTPYWRHCLTQSPPAEPLPAPTMFPGSSALSSLPDLESEKLSALGLEPEIDWAGGIRETWRPGEAGARTALQHFALAPNNGETDEEDDSDRKSASPGNGNSDAPLWDYTEQRNLPARRGTSRLSPHLHFGEVSPRQVWHAVRRAAEAQQVAEPVWTRWQYISEIGWREFSHHLIYHFPHTAEEPLREEFERFPWLPLHHGSRSAEALRRYKAWTRGRTGYPLVDAGMRELWATGWMHNRIRMVTASFLVKHLLIAWQEGARWYWDTLVDADLAQNTAGWQWTAGCGADASPYFRIFNPVAQGEKFDPKGEYIRRWVPELQSLGDKYIHAPWTAPPEVLHHAGITLGRTYPHPIVDHTEARKAALDALATLKAG